MEEGGAEFKMKLVDVLARAGSGIGWRRIWRFVSEELGESAEAHQRGTRNNRLGSEAQGAAYRPIEFGEGTSNSRRIGGNKTDCSFTASRILSSISRYEQKTHLVSDLVKITEMFE